MNRQKTNAEDKLMQSTARKIRQLMMHDKIFNQLSLEHRDGIELVILQELVYYRNKLMQLHTNNN